MSGDRVLPPRPRSPDSHWEYAGWTVLNWRMHDDYEWAFSLLMPDGSRYENQPINDRIQKRPYDDYYTVKTESQATARECVKIFIEAIEFKSPKKKTSCEKTSCVPKFDPSPEIGDEMWKQELKDLRYAMAQKVAMEYPPDTSWMKMREVGPHFGRFARKEKSLFREWRERRAAKKAERTQIVDAGTED